MDFSSILSCIRYLFLASWLIWALTHGAFGPGLLDYPNQNEKYHDKPGWFKVVETITFSGIAIIFLFFCVLMLNGIVGKILF